MNSHKVFLGLGSNKGNREEYIRSALKKISELKETSIKKVSSLYETKPYGNTEQNDFYNLVAEILTRHDIKNLFSELKRIEREVGRIQLDKKWQPREIDIDILFFNDWIYSDGQIEIPHKDLLNRDFVLVPLIEIDPNFVHPYLGISISEIDFSSVQKNIICKFPFEYK
ncbi:2-amino-4-hydroxy-6-hydroxymethyldihydropteridine diphosphokinase [Melioribacteraceae bacterium 4301-Me]|uniref:2-amino-4-hydroxy-6- hydroxymethyldihydropteridine diphosphokinase n=1 Tax=Pyranulibacter aquaticus TaxID=3163344 RepID=UPI00359BEB41